MIPYQRLEPTQRDQYYRLLNASGKQGCEYSFVNLYLWGQQNAAMVEGYLSIFSHFYGHSMYLYPVGDGPIQPVLEQLRLDAAERGIPFRITGMSRENCDTVETLYPGQYRFISERDNFDYLYRIENLAELKGRKYQQKRNHINRFLAACPNWRLEPVTPALLPACGDLAHRWYQQHAQENPHTNYQLEQRALRRALRHFEELGIEGLLLYHGQLPVAMAMGSSLNETVYDVHFEKAFGEIPGAYAMINRSFARYIRETHPSVVYLNREDDLGLPGLRKAKESYYPDILLEKYWCVLTEGLDDA